MVQIEHRPDGIAVETDRLSAFIRGQGFVSGIDRGSFVDKRTGAREVGFGVAIVDWLIEPGEEQEPWSGWSYRYEFHNMVHGDIPKRLVEGPQICTKARELPQTVEQAPGIAVIRQHYRWTEAAHGRRPGSLWEQTLVFRDGLRYVLVADRVTSVNEGVATALRIDMPGHIRHQGGDTFQQVYLSYVGAIPATAFLEDFPPDARYRYLRTAHNPIPERMIRAYQLKIDGRPGPWLAGMTLDPAVVAEAWCHQRGYVCMIEEVGGWPISAGASFGAAYVVGFFDDVAEMEEVYDRHRGARRLRWDGHQVTFEYD